MAQVQGDDKPISDAELRDAVKAARDRGAHRIEIEALERQRLPKGARAVQDMPPAARPEFLAALEKLGPPDCGPIMRRLAKVAEGAGGQFVVMAFGDAADAKERQALLYVPNHGPAGQVAGGLLEAALELAHKTRRDGSPYRWNVYVAPVLMREGLASGQRGGDKDVIAVLGAVVDFDDGKPYADRVPMEPHAVVDTSPGTGNAQCWWFFDRPMLPSEAAPVIAALTRGCGADPSGMPVSHPFRLPGLMNYPNRKKILAGRKPVRSRLSSFTDGEGLSVEELRTAVLAKYGEVAFQAPSTGEIALAEITWDKPLREPRREISESELSAALNSTEYDDRSKGCWAVLNELLRRGYSPNETAQAMLVRLGTNLASHYVDGAQGPEAAIRADVARAVAKGDWQKQASNPQFLTFPDWTDKGRLRPTTANTRIALQKLEIECRYDKFHDVMTINGHVLKETAGQLSDQAELALQAMIHEKWSFEPTGTAIHDAVRQLGIQHMYDPLLDYLDGLRWDDKARIDTWLIDYLGAKDTPLNRAVGRLVVIAAVRRARHPGCKFDEILILEGPQGSNKSQAVQVLAEGRAGNDHHDFFSDASILSADQKQQQELTRGVWIYEIAEMKGLRTAAIESIKHFASRQSDRCRPAYGRNVIDQPRRCIFIGTIDMPQYLEDEANRRFWPVAIGHIDIAALKRDRDQLWAEAAQEEKSGASIRLDPSLWTAARSEQEQRRIVDPWLDILDARLRGPLGQVLVMPDADGIGFEERISSADLLHVLDIPLHMADKRHYERLAKVMRRLGWDGPKQMRIRGTKTRGYTRPVDPLLSELMGLTGAEETTLH